VIFSRTSIVGIHQRLEGEGFTAM